MNRVDILMKQLCPDGVPFTTLGRICSLSRGRVISKDYLRANVGNYPVYSSQTANQGVFGRINTYDHDGTYITWTTDGANAGSVFYHEEKKFSITNVCGLIRNTSPDQIKLKFIYYVLSETAKRYVYSGMGNPKLMSNKMSTIPIPIPPLQVQEQIIKTLDTFKEPGAGLEAELEAELEARKRQYAHYRDKLLKFEKCKVDYKTIGEIGYLVRGSGLQKKDFTNTGIGCIHYGQIYTHYGTFATETKSFVSKDHAKRLKQVQPGDIVIAVTSEDIEGVCKPVAWLGRETIVAGGDSLIFKHDQNPKYVSYLFQTTDFQNQKRRYARGAKVIRVSKDDLNKIKIPVPPISEQKRIVGILDKFDALVNNIAIGLPAEISLRRKQYEYYRSQLLDFKESA